MEQPKDYETFEEFFDSEMAKLSPLARLTYHLQDHLWKAIFVVGVGGYIAGAYFGIFW